MQNWIATHRRAIFLACCFSALINSKPAFSVKKVGALAYSKNHPKAQVETPDPILRFRSSINQVPMISEAFRHPDFSKQKKMSSSSVKLSLDRIQYYSEKISEYKGAAYQKALRDYFSALVGLRYYWEDKLLTKVKSSQAAKNLKTKIYSSEKRLRKIASKLLKISKNSRLSQDIWFTLSLLDYVKVSRRPQAIKNMRKLVKGSLAPRKKNLLILALSLHDLDHRDDKKRLEAIKSIDRIHNELPKHAGMLAHLVLAKGLAGLDHKGKKISSFFSEYRQQLLVVSSLCRNLNKKNRQDILVYSLGVWVHAQDFTKKWGNPPFKTECFKHLPDMLAIDERKALMHWRKGQLFQAKKIYGEILPHVERNQDKLLIEERQISLSNLIYQRDQNAFVFQKHLIEIESQNRGSIFGIRLQNMHYKLLQGELRKSALSKKSSLITKRAEPLLKRYLASQVYDHRAQKLKIELADLYRQYSMFRKSEHLYGDLSHELQGENKKKYLKKQIDVQAHLAKWNTKDPWVVAAGVANKSREHLLRLYYNLFQLEKSLAWQVSKHIGLLEIDLGRPQKAYFVWRNAVKADRKSPAAQKSLGLLMYLAKKAKDWQHLEDIIYLAMENHVTPLHESTRLSIRDELEKSLFLGSKELVAKGLYSQAIKKLRILENTYVKSQKFSEYLFLLATAFKKNQQHERSLEAFETLLTLNKAAKFYDLALLEAASYHTGMANFPEALKMYRVFLSAFPNSKSAISVKKRLAEIYFGKSDFENASSILATIDLTKLKKEDQEAIQEKILYATIKHGNTEDIKKLAQENISLGGALLPRLRSYAILAQQHFHDKNSADLKKIENKIQSMDQKKASVADTLSYIWFLQVKQITQEMLRSFKGVLTKNIAGSVGFLDSSYREASKSFRAVCHIKHAAYCVPSMDALISFNQRVLSLLNDITTNEDLDVKLKTDFEREKKELKLKLAGDLKILKSETSSILAEGHTDPKTTRNFLWSLARDWNFRAGPETGAGFIQLSGDYVKGKNNETF